MEEKQTDDITKFLLLLTVFNRPLSYTGSLKPSNVLSFFPIFLQWIIFKPSYNVWYYSKHLENFNAFSKIFPP